MSKIFDYKLIFIAIFLLLSIAIQNCENFQFKKDGSSNDKNVAQASKTKIRFPFRKLEKVEMSEEDQKDADDDDNNDDDDDDDKVDIKSFAKVRRQKFEVKKRPEYRFSKLAQFRDDSTDDDNDDNDDDEEEESQSFFSKIWTYFKSKPKKESEESESDTNDSQENDDDDDDNDQNDSAEVNENDDNDDDHDDDEETETKPLLTEMFDKFKSFLDARNQNQDRNSQPSSDEDNTDESGDHDDEAEQQPDEESESTLKNAIKNVFNDIFNRKPFNLIFDFDGDDDDESPAETYEDSEEDELNYQRLLKEEREQEKLKTENLINQEVQEETVQKIEEVVEEEVEEPKPSKNAVKKPSKPKPKKTKEELNLAQAEFEKLLLNLPSFVPDYSKVKNPECQKQGEVFQRQLRGQKLWALQMMDANAKIPSGLLRGNVNQLGDFDLCTKIAQKIKITESTTIKMKGKYCLANIDVVAAVDQLKLPVHLMQGRNFIRSTINDPSHFFPRYSTINWGLCLPSACTYNDADNILESFIGPYNSTGIKLHISVDEDSCFIRHSTESIDLIKSDWKIFGTCLIIFVVVSATVLSTLNEYLDSPLLCAITHSKANQEQATENADTKAKSNDSLLNKLLSCFSLKRNLPSLWTVSNEDEEIKCLHGLKAISIILLFISLKLIPMGRVPYTNRNKFTEFFNSPLSVFLRSSFLYEDVFLVISGLLASISAIKDISSGGKIVWFKKLLGRFLRLLLPLSIVLLFYAFVFEHLSTGPQWNLITKNADLCQNSMWRNLLFVQNFYPFEDMCASHTYHLAIDFQLFILTPLLVWLIYKNPTFGFGVYGVLHTLSAGARFSTTAESRLSTVVFHGMKLSQLYRTFNLSFTVAMHRATPYLIGIALGVVVKEFGKVKLAQGVKASGWLATLAGIVWCYYKPSNLSHKDYQYDPTAAAQYSALAPLLWGLSISWIIFACHSDESWKLNSILSSRIMIFISRISFSIYLVIFIVFFYFSGTLKSSEEFHVLSYLDRLETCIVLLTAVLFTLVVDIPSQNIVRLLLGGSNGNSSNDLIENNGKTSVDDEEIEDIFANNDDDFVYKRKPKYFSYDDEHVNGDHLNGNGKLNEVEEEEQEQEEEESVVEAKIEIKPKAMNARRWKWEVTDD